MSVVKLGSNIASLTAQRRLSEGTSSLTRTFERLSSGMRINRASDDAAGLAISSSLKSDVRVYSQAIRNINDGLSALSIAEGALKELSSIAIRQKELAEQAANGVYSRIQRKALNDEVNALVDEYNRVVATTKFNGIGLLDNSITEGVRIQAGYGLDGSVLFNINENLSRFVGNGIFDIANLNINDGNVSGYDSVGGDINGDGIIDILAVGLDEGTGTCVNVLIGNGDGTFKAAVTYQTNSGPFYIKLADMNGDGKLDFITNGLPSSSIAIAFGNGDGTFNAARTYTGLAFPGAYGISDFNNDGINDIVSSTATGTMFILGNQDGSLRAPSLLGSGSSEGFEIGDFNGDGNLDILGYRDIDPGYTLYLGNGNGTFSNSRVTMGGLSIVSAESGDFNYDGILDLAVADENNDAVHILFGNGDGSFRAGTSLAVPDLDAALEQLLSMQDLNGDGILDIFISSTNSSTGYTFLGNRDGSFNAARISSGLGTAYSKFYDFNGDNVLDILTTVGDGNVYTILAQSSKTSNIESLNITTVNGAKNALNTINGTLNRISSELGAIGSFQSRLQVALNNIITSKENFEAASSRITDADMAEESAGLIRTNILQQAAASVLAQANQQPALALTLLKQ